VGAESLVRERTGLVIDPYFSGRKSPGCSTRSPRTPARRARRARLRHGRLVAHMAAHGNRTHVTDVSNASRTLLFNIHTNDWDDELLRLLRYARDPSRRASFGARFRMVPAAAFGEPPSSPACRDQQAAMFGQACHAPAWQKTLRHRLLHAAPYRRQVVQSKNGLVATACAQTRAKEYALEGSVFIGGAVVQWLRDQLGFFSSSSEIERLAAE